MDLQERILLGGVPGVGKTYATLTIARMLFTSGNIHVPPKKMYIIDPDDGVRRVWFNEFPEVENIEYYFTPRWYTSGSEKVPEIQVIDKARHCYTGGIADVWKTIHPKLKSGDWLSVEHLGNIWGLAQGGFADEVFSKDIGQYFLEARKQMAPGGKKLEALKGWTDWTVINKLHNDDFMIPVCYDNPAHVIMTTSISIVDANAKEEAEIKAAYGETNIRLEGQKHNPFRAQTILMLLAHGSGDKRKYTMSTLLKDRGRPWMDKVELFDFAYQYLVEIAGLK